MKLLASQAQKELRLRADKTRVADYQRFFQTHKGGYGEGDKFLGVVMPAIRSVAKKFRDLPRDQVIKLLDSSFHEDRMLGLLILVDQFKLADQVEQKKIFQLYCQKIKTKINNWDLVDVTCPHIVGAWTYEHDRNKLLMLARSKNLWQRRVGIVCLLWYVKQKEIDLVFTVADLVRDDQRDLIHKAFGWMLREAGKVDQKALENYLEKRAVELPRTALRYAVERLPETKRRRFMRRPL